MIIWLAEWQVEGFPRKDRIGINEHNIVVGQSVWSGGLLDGEISLSHRIPRAKTILPQHPTYKISKFCFDVAKRLATEAEVTEALDEFLQRDIDLPYVRLEAEEIFAALPEWTRINTLEWSPEGVA